MGIQKSKLFLAVPLGYIYSYRARMTASNHLPIQLLTLSFGFKACKLYLEDSDSSLRLMP